MSLDGKSGHRDGRRNERAEMYEERRDAFRGAHEFLLIPSGSDLGGATGLPFHNRTMTIISMSPAERAAGNRT